MILGETLELASPPLMVSEKEIRRLQHKLGENQAASIGSAPSVNGRRIIIQKPKDMLAREKGKERQRSRSQVQWLSASDKKATFLFNPCRQPEQEETELPTPVNLMACHNNC